MPGEEYEYYIGDKKCNIGTDVFGNGFVGIKYDGGRISVSFPLGYHISEEDDSEGIRKKILQLIDVLSRYSNMFESQTQAEALYFSKEEEFPIQAYLYVISDFISRGYYKETETRYICGQRGKINWPRTIKTQKPYIQDNEAYYLKFITKNTRVKDDELITLIHEYCVYESFEKMGWLFTEFMPQEPRIKWQKELFLSVINEKLHGTFNDRNRKLFLNMKAIIEGKEDPNSTKFYFGTNRFEYVWEAMVDQVYGIKGKENYFPKTYWNINGTNYDNSKLRPDSIMVVKGKENTVYILDAKYYHYGVTGKPNNLPASSSVHKQITYGEYMAETYDNWKNLQKDFPEVFKEKDELKVYNAFLMPFNAKEGSFNSDDGKHYYAGTASSSWKKQEKTYEVVHGILIDTNYLIECCSNIDNNEEKNKLATIIDKEIKSIIEKENRSVESMKNSLN